MSLSILGMFIDLLFFFFPVIASSCSLGMFLLASFLQQISVEYLEGTGHCARHWSLLIDMYECQMLIHLFSKYLLSDQLCARYCADLVVIKIFISISFSEFNLPCVPLSIEMQDTEMNMGSYEHLWTFNF